MKKILLALVCVTSCLCSGSLLASGTTPGEKIDKAIDKAKEKAEEAKEAAQDKYDDAKEAAKKESDKARKDIADKVKPSR